MVYRREHIASKECVTVTDKALSDSITNRAAQGVRFNRANIRGILKFQYKRQRAVDDDLHKVFRYGLALGATDAF